MAALLPPARLACPWARGKALLGGRRSLGPPRRCLSLRDLSPGIAWCLQSYRLSGVNYSFARFPSKWEKRRCARVFCDECLLTSSTFDRGCLDQLCKIDSHEILLSSCLQFGEDVVDSLGSWCRCRMRLRLPEISSAPAVIDLRTSLSQG